MKQGLWIGSLVGVCLTMTTVARAETSAAELIASAESAAPPSVTKGATIKAPDGKVLREGSNGWTCYPQQESMGPMCNQAGWEGLLHAFMSKTTPKVETLSVSYMLAGEGTALGTSNIDPYATEPTDDNDWVKEGPHLMIAVPDPSMLKGISSDPKDPVYVMWKDTPYAHIMVRVAPEK